MKRGRDELISPWDGLIFWTSIDFLLLLHSWIGGGVRTTFQRLHNRSNVTEVVSEITPWLQLGGALQDEPQLETTTHAICAALERNVSPVPEHKKEIQMANGSKLRYPFEDEYHLKIVELVGLPALTRPQMYQDYTLRKLCKWLTVFFEVWYWLWVIWIDLVVGMKPESPKPLLILWSLVWAWAQALKKLNQMLILNLEDKGSEAECLRAFKTAVTFAQEALAEPQCAFAIQFIFWIHLRSFAHGFWHLIAIHYDLYIFRALAFGLFLVLPRQDLCLLRSGLQPLCRGGHGTAHGHWRPFLGRGHAAGPREATSNPTQAPWHHMTSGATLLKISENHSKGSSPLMKGMIAMF